MVGGKLFVKALRYPDDDSKGRGGQPIANKRDAEAAQVVLMAGFRVGDETAALENVRAKLDSRQTELVKVAEVDAGRITVSGAWEKYLAAGNRPDSGERTLGFYAGQWRAFATWMQKHHPAVTALREVSTQQAAAYAADLARSCSASTFNRHTALLTLVFRVLTKPAMITLNPFAEVRRKRAMQHGRRELTVEELRRVCTDATGELRTLLAVGTYTGLRLGDCATLNWSECDLVRGLIRRIPNKTARRTPKPVLVPIHGALAAILKETPEDARRGYVLPELAVMYQKDSAALTKRIQKHLKACGVRTQAEGTGFVMKKCEDGTEKKTFTGKRAVVEVGFHSLRHTFVSLCREAGAPLSVVESIVGHSSPAMTRHYTHTGEAAARSAIAMLPGLKDKRTMLPPEDRLKQLLAKVRRMPAAKVKRAVLRLLAGMRVKAAVRVKVG
jgi:integrase